MLPIRVSELDVVFPNHRLGPELSEAFPKPYRYPAEVHACQQVEVFMVDGPKGIVPSCRGSVSRLRDIVVKVPEPIGSVGPQSDEVFVVSSLENAARARSVLLPVLG